jgi:SET domain
MERLAPGDCKHGKGVFATGYINTGSEVLQFAGPFVGFEELPHPYSEENDYYLQIGDGIFLGPSGGIDDYVNHSCCPNTGVLFDSEDIKLVAITPIPAGSEITFDYSTTMDNFWWEMECSCGLANCRRKIKNFMDLAPEIQARYIQLGVVPYYILKNFFIRNSKVESINSKAHVFHQRCRLSSQ